MFEQFMLLEDATGKRTRALAASLTLQVLVMGVLLLIPLIYGDRLPTLQPWTPVVAPPPRALQQSEQVKPAAQPQTRTGILVARPLLLPSSTTQPLDQSPAIISFDGVPIASNTVGSPFELPIVPGFSHIVAEPPALLSAAATVKEPDRPHPVGGDVQSAKLIRKVVPGYPLLAKQARVSGTVHLVGVIAKDGAIRQLQVVSGNPLLVRAALDAVRQWVYQPTLLNGEAVEVVAPIDVIFTLSQ